MHLQSVQTAKLGRRQYADLITSTVKKNRKSSLCIHGILDVLYRGLLNMQVQNFIAGIKPIQSIIRIGSAAGQLLAIPMEQLRSKGFAKPYEGQPSRVSAPVSWQLQRGFTGGFMAA